MKRKFKMEGLCCANCAAKIEAGIQKIQNVAGASLNFMMQKLTIEAEEAHFDAILLEADRIAQKIEPDCRILR